MFLSAAVVVLIDFAMHSVSSAAVSQSMPSASAILADMALKVALLMAFMLWQRKYRAGILKGKREDYNIYDCDTVHLWTSSIYFREKRKWEGALVDFLSRDRRVREMYLFGVEADINKEKYL
jgi:hypothetical protein